MKKVLLSLFAAVLFVSCGSKVVTPLSGEWNIVEVNGKGLVGDNASIIGFNVEEGEVYGNNTCNSFFGKIVTDKENSSVLSFANVGTTRMLCPNSPMEEEVNAAINAVASFKYTEGGNAELLDKDGKTILTITPKTATEEAK